MSTVAEFTIPVPPKSDNLLLEPSQEFVLNSSIQSTIDRALAYLEAGYAVHFAGPAGAGKTTLAFHVAALRGRPTTMMQGDEEFGSSDLIGNDSGFRKSKVVDNYIHSVLRMQEETRTFWTDNRLTTACRNGDTLIYDEFNRSRPEANNVLLSVLSERILHLPRLRHNGQGYLQVHPEFRAIFTSNPEEYTGVHKAQDALLDRMITIRVDHYDLETEVQIIMSRSGLPYSEARGIVDLVRKLRQRGETTSWPSLRAAIAIARISRQMGIEARYSDPVFRRVCRDVLNVNPLKASRLGADLSEIELDALIREACGL
jgi:gas vesicle protein GvpN